MSEEKKPQPKLNPNLVDKGASTETDDEDILDMEQAIALLKTTRPTFYRWLRAGKIKGMKVGRQWRFYKRDIDAFLRGEGPSIALPGNIEPLKDELAKRYQELGGDPTALSAPDELREVTHLIVAVAVGMRASDIHIHPQYEGQAILRLRADGVLHTIASFAIRLLPAVVAQWKMLCGLPQERTTASEVGRALLEVGDRMYDCRSSFLPTALGESVTVRIFDPSAGMKFAIEDLGFSESNEAALTRCAESSYGLAIVTGPTGCGKTTTLYSILSRLDTEQMKVMTLEDPVEVLLPGILQMNLNPDTGMTFRDAIIGMFRSDPDAMMIGEIRDIDTLELCLKGAATGHLVLSSMHAPDAVSALTRISDMQRDDPDLKFAGNILRLIFSQRLLRRVCDNCSEPVKLADDVLDNIEMLACAGGLDWSTIPQSFRKSVGCPQCANTGYRGRAVVGEALEVTPAIQTALLDQAAPEELLNIAVEQGMVTMSAEAIRLAAEGVTTLDEATRVFGFNLSA